MNDLFSYRQSLGHRLDVHSAKSPAQPGAGVIPSRSTERTCGMIPHHQKAVPTSEQHPHVPLHMQAGSAQKSPCKPVPPPPPADGGPTYVPTNQPFLTTVQSIQNAASGAGRWQGTGKQPPYYVRRTAKSATTIEYGREETQQIFTDRAILNLWKDVREFSDRDADLLLSIFSAIIRETNGAGAAWIWASHFLDQRGVRPIMKREGALIRRAGHRLKDIADIDQAIYRLSGLWITIEEVFPARRKGGKARVYRHQGRVLTVVETWSQHTLDVDGQTPERLPVAWKIRAGDWLMEYLQAPRYVAAFCDQSLRYDPENEKWEKRLSRYFLFFLRINSRHQSSTLVRSIEELLQANSLPLDLTNPQRSRQRLEKALNRLLADQQMEHWEYVPASMSDLPAKQWLKTWLQWNVRISVHARPAPSG